LIAANKWWNGLPDLTKVVIWDDWNGALSRPPTVMAMSEIIGDTDDGPAYRKLEGERH